MKNISLQPISLFCFLMLIVLQAQAAFPVKNANTDPDKKKNQNHARPHENHHFHIFNFSRENYFHEAASPADKYRRLIPILSVIADLTYVGAPIGLILGLVAIKKHYHYRAVAAVGIILGAIFSVVLVSSLLTL